MRTAVKIITERFTCIALTELEVLQRKILGFLFTTSKSELMDHFMKLLLH